VSGTMGENESNSSVPPVMFSIAITMPNGHAFDKAEL